MSQPRGSNYHYYHQNGNPTAGSRPLPHSAPILYQMKTATSPGDVIEKDSRCYHPPLGRSLSSQPALPCGSRDEEKDMKRTPTTPRSPPPPAGNPGDNKPRPTGTGSGQFDPLSGSSYTARSSYTSRGPHVQSMGSGSRSNSGSSLLSMSSSSSSSMSHGSMSSELGGVPRHHGRDNRGMVQQYGMYDNRTGVSGVYYRSSRVPVNPSNPRLRAYHLPPSIVAGQSAAQRYGDSGALRTTGYREQQAAQLYENEMGYGVGPTSKYRSRVQSTGSMGRYSPPISSHYHTPGGYASLGDRLTGPSSNVQSYGAPYDPSVGAAYRREYVPDSNYTPRHYPLASNYSTLHYAHQLPIEPQYTHDTEEYDPYQTPYDYDFTEPQPMSLSVSALQNDEVGGQPLEHLTNDLNSKLALEQSAKKHAQSQSDDDNDQLQITEHPKDTKVSLKQVATLSCRARVLDSKEEPNFLWYKDTEPLIGEIDSDYVVEEATEKDEGVYYCLVSHPQDDKLQKTSNSAQLTVRTGKDPPEIIRQPSKEVLVVIGERLKLVLEASGEAPLRYKWYKDTREMSFATASTLEIPSVTFTDSGAYCCTISNTHGSVLSDTFNVSVTVTKFNPIQKQRPSSLHNWEDQPLTDLFLKEVGVTIAQQTRNLNRIALYLGLSNTDMIEIKVQFYQPEEQAFHILRKWSQTIRGSSRNRRMLRTILSQAGINLDLMMTSGKHAQIKPNVPKPKISVQPQSKKVLYGNSFELSIQVETNRYFEYQWYKNHQPLGGKTHPQIFVNSAVDSDSGDYYCVIKNDGGSVTSNVASIEVIVPSARQPVPSGPPLLYARSSGPVNQPWSRSGGGGGVKASPGLYSGLIERGLPSLVHVETAEQPVCEGKPISGHVNSMPQILKHPLSQTVELGDPLTLTCKAVLDGQLEEELRYEWFFNGLSMQHENRAEYHINCFTDEDEGLYSCRVSNSCGGVTSNIAHVQMRSDSD